MWKIFLHSHILRIYTEWKTNWKQSMDIWSFSLFLKTSKIPSIFNFRLLTFLFGEILLISKAWYWVTSLAPHITKIKSSVLCQSPTSVWLQMGAVGPASASCSFWVVQVPPPKRSYSSQRSTKDFWKKLWCCWRIQSSTHHPGIHLAKIGNIQNIKEENIKHPFIL
jgi:hypothetical protein